MYRISVALGLIALGIMSRLLPHLPNATAVSTLTLVARKELGGLWSYAVPLSIMLISDSILGFYNWKILLSVYISFLLMAVLSRWAAFRIKILRFIAFAISSSLLFFLITNFCVWLFSEWYTKNIEGLLYCYFLGLPFLGYSLLGDLTCVVLVWGLYFVYSRVQFRFDTDTQGVISWKTFLLPSSPKA